MVKDYLLGTAFLSEYIINYIKGVSSEVVNCSTVDLDTLYQGNASSSARFYSPLKRGS